MDQQLAEIKCEFIEKVVWSGCAEENADDLVIAKKFLKELTKEKNPRALNLKGAMYFEGACVEKDWNKAFKFYRKAADLGDSLAMCNLAYCYFDGNGTKKDLQSAYYYFNKAAMLGEPDAYIKLGDIYREGLMGPEDKDLAFCYYVKCLKECNHNEHMDAYPVALSRIAETLMYDNRRDASPEQVESYLDDAERIFEMQIANGRIYAEPGLEHLHKLQDEFVKMMGLAPVMLNDSVFDEK